ncbi:hypothetical protein GIB67_003296, partial [Kingdonia uniflora]
FSFDELAKPFEKIRVLEVDDDEDVVNLVTVTPVKKLVIASSKPALPIQDGMSPIALSTMTISPMQRTKMGKLQEEVMVPTISAMLVVFQSQPVLPLDVAGFDDHHGLLVVCQKLQQNKSQPAVLLDVTGFDDHHGLHVVRQKLWQSKACDVRFSGRVVCDAKSLVSTDVLVSKVGVLPNFHELRADEADLVGHLSPVIGVGDEEDTVVELIEWPRLKGYRVEYPTSSSQFREFYKAKAGRVWNDNLLWVSSECLQRSDEEPLELKNKTITKGINCKVSRKESFIDIVVREGTELNAVLKELEISRFKRVASKDDKLARLNEILDGPVDIATVSNTAVRSLAKRKAIKRRAAPRSVSSLDDNSKRRKVISPTKSQEMLDESDMIAEGADLRLRFEVEADIVEEQCRAKAREKMVVVMDEEFKKFVCALKDVQVGSQDRSMKLEKKISQLEGEKNQLEEKLTRERVDFQLEREKEKEAAALKLKQVSAEKITAFSEGNYEEMEIIDEEEVEEREGGLNTTEKTDADNQETINQEMENSRLRVVNSEGLLEVEKKSSAELQKELDTAREKEEQTLFYNAEYAEVYEALISQYEDRLNNNVKLSLKLEEAKRQVEEKTAIILSRDLALNQLTSELAELKQKAASGSQHEAELAKYHIRVLNEEISDMKCIIRALNELLLKSEIDLDTARTNLVVSEANFEKLSSNIMGKDQELCNSEQIRDSLIARLDRLKDDLRRLKGKEAHSRADLVKIPPKSKNLVDDLAHAHGNVKRVMQREKEMNERIN